MELTQEIKDEINIFCENNEGFILNDDSVEMMFPDAPKEYRLPLLFIMKQFYGKKINKEIADALIEKLKNYGVPPIEKIKEGDIVSLRVNNGFEFVHYHGTITKLHKDYLEVDGARHEYSDIIEVCRGCKNCLHLFMKCINKQSPHHGYCVDPEYDGCAFHSDFS